MWWYWRDVLVLRRNSREWQLGVGISWFEKQWTVQFWSYDLISEVSTNGVFILTSRLCHVWLCDVASPIPSWHRLRRGGVTFGRLAVIVLLIYCTVLYLDFARWTILDVVDSWRFQFLHVCLVIMAGNCLWYILDWNFRDARGVYNCRLCGRLFSWTSSEVVAVRIVGVFVWVWVTRL